MRSWLLPLLLLSSTFVGLLIPPDVQAGTNADAKIAGHLKAHTTKGVCTTSAERPPCNPGESHLNVQGQVGVPYDLYLMVLDGDSTAGVAGAVFGIAYNGAPQAGVDVMGWTLCADLEFTGGPSGIAWPDSGSGNLITWDAMNQCQRMPAWGDSSGGVTAVLGALYVYAYSDDAFQFTPRQYVPSPDLQVASCSAEKSGVQFPMSIGLVAFGETFEGRDPCDGSDSIPPARGDDSDSNPPGGITSLEILNAAPDQLAKESNESEQERPWLTWIAPGDDGYVGKALTYSLFLDQDPASVKSCLDESESTGLPVPKESGTRQYAPFPRLQSGTTYYAAIRAVDDRGNEGPVSNIVSLTYPELSDTFLDTIALGASNLWVAGHEITARPVIVAFDGNDLRIDGQTVNIGRGLQRASRLPPETVRALCEVPYFRSLVASGLDSSRAADLYCARVVQLDDEARDAYLRGGSALALQVLQQSPLVETVTISDTWASIDYRGDSGHRALALEVQGRGPRTSVLTARSIASHIRMYANEVGSPTAIFIPKLGGLQSVGGVDAPAAEAQARQIIAQRGLGPLPPGPLRVGSPVVLELQEAARGGGGQ